MASSRAVDFLRRYFPEVHQIHGLHILYEDNRVRKGRTLLSNALASAAALPKQIRSYFELVEDFAPQIVISDFESWTYFYAKAHRLPIISIDNMQVINRCKHSPDILEGIRGEFELTRALIKSKLPFCDHYMITSFFTPELRKERTTLVPPILRPEILNASQSVGDHVLVYQTAEGHGALLRALAAVDVPCRIYGMRRDLQSDMVEDKMTFRPFDEQTFIADLASAKAVISGGGFTVLGECVYLRKPTLCIPVGGQVEQEINGRYLAREGYGMVTRGVDEATLREFLVRLPEFNTRLASYQQDGNRVTFDTLSMLLSSLSDR